MPRPCLTANNSPPTISPRWTRTDAYQNAMAKPVVTNRGIMARNTAASRPFLTENLYTVSNSVEYLQKQRHSLFSNAKCKFPDSKVHGAYMGPIWDRQGPGGPHVGPMNFAVWVTNCYERPRSEYTPANPFFIKIPRHIFHWWVEPPYFQRCTEIKAQPQNWNLQNIMDIPYIYI